ncbi:MAG: (Fe-S)-binding protein [Anaerolineae bacterium]|nr:(Fe-S)-binding protein [Anaerolineae bacterium]
MQDIQQFANEIGLDLDLLACIQCGKCSGGCPVSITTALNIRFLVYESLLDALPELVHMEELWDCTCCFTCVERCPKDVRPAELIITLRNQLVESGKIPGTIGEALMGIFRQGNPLGLAREDRALWAEGLDVKPAREGCDTLLFTCCYSAYDVQSQPATKALVRILHAAGVDLGYLGTEETCCGNEVKRVGEKAMFDEMLVEEGKALLESVGARCIVTTSPHCYNTFKNEYGLEGIEVLHYTQVLARLLEEGQLKLSVPVEKTVTYHDPCFLGKQNKVFDEPRAVLRAIPGLNFVEMDRIRERSLCCEGGGGRMWFEGTNTEDRLAFQRVQEAVDTGAEVLAVACPFCLAMLADAAKVKGLEEQLKVMDISELVVQALGDGG